MTPNSTIDISPGRVLVICLANWSFGEATLGIRLINNSKFSAVHFVISPFLSPLLLHHKIDFTKLVPYASSGLNKLLFTVAIQQFKPDEIILADSLIFQESEEYYGLTEEYINSFGIPISCIDVYALSCRGEQVALPDGLIFEKCKALMEKLERFYIPCPVFDPLLLSLIKTDGRIACYSALPQLELNTTEIQRSSPRKELRIVITSAAWEDKLPVAESRRWVHEYVRQYIFDVLTDLSKHRRLHIDVVGMSEMKDYISSPNIFYKYHATVPPSQLQELIAKANIYFTSNVIASSISVSLALDTPVVCVTNAEAIDVQIQNINVTKSENMKIFTLPPFLVSPIGWYDFLYPLLQKNRYFDMLHFLDIRTPINVASNQILDLAEMKADFSNDSYLHDIQNLPKVILGLNRSMHK